MSEKKGCGLECRACGGNLDTVTDTRKGDEYIRRRRECSGCGARATTYEVLDDMRWEHGESEFLRHTVTPDLLERIDRLGDLAA